MQLPFSEANAIPFITPKRQIDHRTLTIAVHIPPSIAYSTDDVAFDPANPDIKQASIPALDQNPFDQAELNKAAPLEVVKQTIDELEAQGLLMLFDRHDQVAKRLTGDLIAAGVLQEDLPLNADRADCDR